MSWFMLWLDNKLLFGPPGINVYPFNFVHFLFIEFMRGRINNICNML